MSVVGDFNFWDGRRHQMRRIGDAGIFEIFIPGVKPGMIYKYEVKTKSGIPMLKADPYGNFAELRPNTASVVWDIDAYQWQDAGWMEKRKAVRKTEAPMSVYEVHLGSWMQKAVETDENGEAINGSQFYNYREIAEEAGGIREGDGLYPCGTDAGHGTSPRRLLGLPGDGLLCAHKPLRDAG